MKIKGIRINSFDDALFFLENYDLEAVPEYKKNQFLLRLVCYLDKHVWKTLPEEQKDELLYLANNLNLTLAHLAAKHGNLPEDFNKWDLRDYKSKTVAHMAAEHGNIPEGFDWKRYGLMCDIEGRTVYHSAAEGGCLPEWFDEWHLEDEDGWTVAHFAAYYCKIPGNFDWQRYGMMRDTRYGETVYHEAASNKCLPQWFDDWDIADNNGKTVAHNAALGKNLPGDFDWERYGLMRDNDGRTVYHFAGYSKKFIAIKILKQRWKSILKTIQGILKK